jgi:hypothetical protein
MTLNVSISAEAEAKLAAQATAVGRDPASLASDILERAVLSAPSESHRAAATLAAWDKFAVLMQEYTKSLPQGHVVDDSRETIYAGRGE